MSLTAEAFFCRGGSEYDPRQETEFFATLKMRNGTFKLTHPARFAEVDEALGTVIAGRARTLRRVLDVGVSSGITTIELADFLKRNGVEATYTATDLFMAAHIVRAAPGVRVLTDSEGWPLQYDVAGVAVRPWIRRLDYLTMAFLPRLLARTMARRRARALVARGQSRSVQLISPRLSERADVEVIEDDIMKRRDAFANRFDLVRVGNLLNLNYFSTEKLRRAVGNVRSYLRGPDALFLVTRTSRDRNTGSLFELTAHRTFRVVARMGGGSEIEDLVIGLAEDT